MQGARRSGWERKYGRRGISTGFRLSVDRPPSQLSHRQREREQTLMIPIADFIGTSIKHSTRIDTTITTGKETTTTL